MSKEQFLNELEYLLQDLGEEAGDAVGYYRDYFEEAGPEREAEVLEELGSPERIAAIVRADIRGELDSGGGFTDRGYEDERFRDPGYQMVKRLDLPERAEGRSTSAGGGEPGGSHHRNMEGKGAGGRGAAGNSRTFSSASETGTDGRSDPTPGTTGFSGSDPTSETSGFSSSDQTAGASGFSGSDPAHGSFSPSGSEPGPGSDSPNRRNKFLTLLLLAFLAVLALPVVLGIGSGLFGIGAAIFSLLITLVIGIAAVTLALVLGGIVAMVGGVIVMAANFPVGLLILGIGILTFGLGLLGIALSVVFYGRALPAMIRWAVDMVRRLFGGRKGCVNG